MISAIQSGVADYAGPPDGPYGKIVRRAVEEGLHGFAERDSGRLRKVYRMIGAGEAAAGRPLDALQQALRICARVAWRRLADDGERLGLSHRRMCDIGEAILVYLDEIAAAAADGYAEVQARAAGELESRRRRLLDLLTSNTAEPWAIEDLARAVDWPLPKTVAGVALAARPSASAPRPPGDPSKGRPRDGTPAHGTPAHGTPVHGLPVHGLPRRPHLPPDVLADLDRADPCLIIPDPGGPGRSRLLDPAVRDWLVVLGPPVPLAEAGHSLRLAREALELARDGVLDHREVVRCADHLGTLILRKDEALLRILQRVRLAPLRRIPPARRGRLAETLLAWLQCGFNANEVAARLHIHPQTVRYRLRQVTDLFAGQLHDPDDRFELEMALRSFSRADDKARGMFC
ncbi:helix-turn-helix domain-containing protein [Streptosporangiaceae bacterium NEAU-GS5]|nr:helix-turn-helix domain-containing protein [Streptosporangiaceae bacterium NEAU-GS5]